MLLQSDIKHCSRVKSASALSSLLPGKKSLRAREQKEVGNPIKAEMLPLLPFPGRVPPLSQSTHEKPRSPSLPMGALPATLHARAPSGVAGGSSNAVAGRAHTSCHGGTQGCLGWLLDTQRGSAARSHGDWQQSQHSCSWCGSEQQEVMPTHQEKKRLEITYLQCRKLSSSIKTSYFSSISI